MDETTIKRERLLYDLGILLLCFNVSVAILTVVLAPHRSSFTWLPNDDMIYWITSRDLSLVPGILLASIVLSWGVHFFVRGRVEPVAQAGGVQILPNTETEPREPAV